MTRQQTVARRLFLINGVFSALGALVLFIGASWLDAWLGSPAAAPLSGGSWEEL